MRKLFLLRGAPGSGKSSFIVRHHLMPYAISRDQIRLLLANLSLLSRGCGCITPSYSAARNSAY